MEQPALSLFEAIEAWLAFRSRSWTCPATAASYKIKTRAWLSFLGPGAELRSIDRVRIQQLFLTRDNGTRSGSWLNDERRSLVGFFRWCMDMGLVEENPVTRATWPEFDPRRKRSKRSRVHLRVTREILEHVLDLALPRYHRVFCFLFLVGTRISETLALLWRDVVQDPQDPSAWILRIPGPSRKTRCGCVVVLSQAVVRILGARGAPDARIFSEAPASRETVRKTLERIGRKLGIANLSSHQFRRSVATALLDAGVPLVTVSHQLGWRSPPREVLDMLDESYYLSADGEQVRRATDRLWHPEH